MDCFAPSHTRPASTYVPTYLPTYLQVAEGYATSFAVLQLIDKISIPSSAHSSPEQTYPIIFTIGRILKGDITPAEGVR